MSTLDFGGKDQDPSPFQKHDAGTAGPAAPGQPAGRIQMGKRRDPAGYSAAPELSILLGTSIDALFSMTDDKRMERIENMLWDQRFLSREEFEAEERFMKDKCLEPDAQARATLLLAELYCKRAREYRELASPLARKALALLPEYDKAATRRCSRRKAASSRTGMPPIITEPSSFTRISSPVTHPSAGRTSGCWICSLTTAAARKRALIWPRPIGWKQAIIPTCIWA